MKNNEPLLERFKKFVKKNSIRIKAGAAATIVAGSIGIASWQIGKDDDADKTLPSPSPSQEFVDPNYNPDGDTHTPGPIGEEDTEHTHKPGGDESHTHKPGETTSNTDTTDPTTTTPPTKPTGEENTEGETHVHQFGEWHSKDSETEVRHCSCGETQTRGHSYRTPVVTYEAADGDSHLVTTTQTCRTCDIVIVKKGYESCTYVLSFDDNQEYLTCSSCEKVHTRDHAFDEGTDNHDGTITYHCINDGCQYVKTKKKTDTPPEEHVHNYGEPVISYIDQGDKGHIKVSTQTCTEEGCPKPVIEIKDEKTTPHVYGVGVNSTDPETGKPIVIYTCKDCGHKKVVERTIGPVDPVEHTHNYNGQPIVNYEQAENGHIKVLTYICIDPNCPNKSDTKVVKSDVIAHSYDREHGIISEDGKTITYKCECGHTITEAYTKPPVEHTHRYEGEAVVSYENITDQGHTKVLTKTCTDPNCPRPGEKQITKTTVSHTYDGGKPAIVDGKEGTIYTCECGHTKFVEKTIGPVDPVHNHNYNGTPVVSYENITETGHTKVLTKTCTDPNCLNPSEKQITKVEESHVWDGGKPGVVDGKEGTIYTCACGHTKFVEKGHETPEHTHTYGEAVVSYENVTDQGHVKVLTKTCTDPKCPNPSEKQVTKVEESHVWDGGVPGVVDGKEGTIYTCACGHTKFVEKTKPPVEHTHNYTEKTEYENVTDTTHTKILVKVCDQEGCPEPRVVISRSTSTHVHDMEHGVVSEDGTTITYKCECGHELVKPYTKPVEHEHHYTEKTEYEKVTDTTHTKVLVKECDVEGCPEPRVIISRSTSTHVHDMEHGVVSEDGTTITYKCECGHELVKPYTKPVEHEHHYTEKTEYENVTDRLHTKVLVKECDVEGCPEPRVVISRSTSTHVHDRDHGVVSEDGTTITYSCECGHTITEAYTKPPEEHKHNYKVTGTECVYVDGTTHKTIITKECAEADCPEDEKIITEESTSGHTPGEVTGYNIGTGKDQALCQGCNHIVEIDHIHKFPEVGTPDFDREGNPILVYQCACGEERIVPVNQEHKHNYKETGRECVYVDGTTHKTIITKECTEADCPEDEKVITEESTSSHTPGEPVGYNIGTGKDQALCQGCNHIVEIDHIHKFPEVGTPDFDREGNPILVYQCACGEEKIVPVNQEHKHNYKETGRECVYVDGTTHKTIITKECTEADCPEDEKIITEESTSGHTPGEVTGYNIGTGKDQALCQGCNHIVEIDHIHKFPEVGTPDFDREGNPILVYQCACGEERIVPNPTAQINKLEENATQQQIQPAENTEQTQIKQNDSGDEDSNDETSVKVNESSESDTDETEDNKNLGETEEQEISGSDEGKQEAEEDKHEENAGDGTTTITQPTVEELLESAPTTQAIIDSGISLEELLASVPSAEEILAGVPTAEEIIEADEASQEVDKPKTLTKNMSN